MNKEIILNGASKELDSPKNLKIRIPSPKVGDHNIEIVDKSKLKKYNIFTYWIYCMYCYPNEE